MIGGSGLLGRRITRQARLAGHKVTATFSASVVPDTDVDWRALDIRRRDDVMALARRVRPTDEVRCPVDATDLASALLELAAAPHAGLRGAREFLAPT